MPTENRSSNTEMVSFPRELSDDLAELIGIRARVCGGGAHDIWEAICEGFAAPAPQPHPEPIAWMVGTAFWWTKEEAERDSGATGLPIVGLGPMTGAAPSEQHQGEPVAPAFVMPSCENSYGFGYVDGTCIQSLRGYRDHLEEIVDSIPEGPLFTHADPGEVERLSQIIRDLNDERDEIGAEAGRLRTQLAEQRGLLKQADEFMYIMTGHDSHARLAHKYGEKWWDAIDKLRGKVCTANSSAAAQVES